MNLAEFNGISIHLSFSVLFQQFWSSVGFSGDRCHLTEEK